MTISGQRRDELLQLSEEEFLKLCNQNFSLGTGPGGQKRNKTATFVRLQLKEDPEFCATDCTERSQERNRKQALRKLRKQLAITIRNPETTLTTLQRCNPDNPNYSFWCAQLLDTLNNNNFDHKATANQLQVSPTMLLKLLAKDPALWQYLSHKRTEAQLSTLFKPN